MLTKPFLQHLLTRVEHDTVVAGGHASSLLRLSWIATQATMRSSVPPLQPGYTPRYFHAKERVVPRGL